jgi:acyl-homoserine-lactone acylase
MARGVRLLVFVALLAGTDPIDVPGSNAFALAGSRTATGKPILLGNPHLNWSSLYREADVRVPGRIDFCGSTLVGIEEIKANLEREYRP